MEAVRFAAASPDPDPATIYEGLFADTTSEDIEPELAAPPNQVAADARLPARQQGPDPRTATRSARPSTEEMLRDRRVVLYGEDVADYGGAFQATVGLLEIFGRERVFNTADLRGGHHRHRRRRVHGRPAPGRAS